MEEELNLEEDNNEEITRKDSRIKSLSDKVKEKAELANAEKARADKAEAERQTALKDAEFFKNFNTTSTKYPGSNEYQDKIREKVALGLDVEEATMLIMAKEGKYTPPEAKVERESPAGGSASTSIQGGEEKTPDKMSQAERLEALKEIEAQGGLDLTKI